MQRILSIIVALAVLAGVVSVNAADWGDLSGTFVLSGDAPAPVPVAAAIPVCGAAAGVIDESLVIGPKKGIKNVVVFLYLKEGEKPPEPHPDYAKTEKANVPLDNKQCRFEPHITLLRTTQTLVVGNKDAFPHSVKIDPLNNDPVSVIIPAGAAVTRFTFPKTEGFPSNVACAIHPWMNAKVVIRESPYFVVTNEDGEFTIRNLPAGKWTFQFWHEKAGYLAKELKQSGKPITWEKGRTEITIAPMGTKLPKVEVGLAAFKKP